MKLFFHGGVQEVTGACYLLEAENARILIDCGLFQGEKHNQDRNFERFRFDPDRIDLALVTHAHIDHTGRIPKLVREGFVGKIFSTAPTKDLSRLLLEDARELNADRDNKKELYNKEDIERALSFWENVEYGKEFEIKGIKIKLHNAGHILGSAMIEIWAEGKHLLFTGDLGNVPSVLLPPPESFEDIEILIIESAYGKRTHDEGDGDKELKLERAVEDIAARRGALLIPAFATERTQDILHLLNEMLLFKRIPEMPIFVDSPLAIKITEVFEKYVGYYKEEIKELFQKHPNLFRFKKLHLTESVEESKSINNVPSPKVIIAGSAMMVGGRVLHHARRYLSDPQSILLIVSFQPRGSLGKRLLEGEKQVKIFGEDVLVEAEIRRAEGFSAHADNPQLFSFIEKSRDTLKKVLVVQGEKEESEYLAQQVKDRLGISAHVPELYEEIEL